MIREIKKQIKEQYENREREEEENLDY